MRKSIALLLLAAVAVQSSEVKVVGDWTVGKGAVTSNGEQCAQIGRDLLAKNGSAVDAIIGVALCEGITGPQSMGIGGGFLATVYSRSTGQVKSLIAREMAPSNASSHMFTADEPVIGGKAAAIPGEIKGYWELHQAYGRLNWSELFEPTIKLCEEGVPIDRFLARTLALYGNFVTKSKTLKDYYWNNDLNIMKGFGDRVYYKTLAQTFRTVANEGASAIYGNESVKVGSVGKALIEDITALGGIMTEDDLHNYTAVWEDPVTTDLPEGNKLYSIPIPGSGPILAYILNLVKGRVEDVTDEALRWHRIIEAFKHGYGYRSQLIDSTFDRSMDDLVTKITGQDYANETIQTKISDATTSNDYHWYNGKFGQEDHGTSNIAVLAPNGDAVTLTSTINNIFGAREYSIKTGIILNDEMDDFSIPNKTNSYGFAPSKSNYIQPGKRPVSSMSPSIILDSSGNVRLLIGAAGGSQITTSVALTTIRHLFLKQSLKQSIGDLRLHHQLLPMEVRFEAFDRKFDEQILEKLRARGHVTACIPTMLGFGAVTGISVIDGVVDPQNEQRRGGSTAVINASEVKSA